MGLREKEGEERDRGFAVRKGDSGLTEVVVGDEGLMSARMAGRAEEVIGTPVAAY